MKKNSFIRCLLIWGGILIAPMYLHGQLCQGVIYGKITLKSGAQYQGQIRWGNEEALWDDIFESAKYERPMQNLLTRDEARRIRRRTEEFEFGFMALWEDKTPNQSFAFRCYFGHIRSLKAQKNNVVLLTLKNEQGIRLRINRGGDLDTDITIFDQGKGRRRFGFDEIETIVFQETPKNYNCPLGVPIYGRVSTTMGAFEGFITWDMEECLGNDKISGKDNGKKIDLAFGNIQTLKARRNGSMITLKNGRALFLNEHDDVGPGNHGITVRGLHLGQVSIAWKNFISAAFMKPQLPPPAYDYFKAPQLLAGTVYLNNGSTLKGQLIYDLDEIYDVEFLNGDNSEYKYSVPFSYVKKIEPQNDKFAAVYLNDESQLLLGNNSDVTIRNHGLIVRPLAGRAEYLEWKDIKHIDFE